MVSIQKDRNHLPNLHVPCVSCDLVRVSHGSNPAQNSFVICKVLASPFPILAKAGKYTTHSFIPSAAQRKCWRGHPTEIGDLANTGRNMDDCHQ